MSLCPLWKVKASFVPRSPHVLQFCFSVCVPPTPALSQRVLGWAGTGQTAEVAGWAAAPASPAWSYWGLSPRFAPAVKPGSVRNIIQHFENNQHHESQEPGAQRLSTGSFPEDLLESDR